MSFIFTWLFNGSGGSLLLVMVFHAAQNSEEIFEVIFPELIGTDWELISSLALLLIGIVIGSFMWYKRKETDPFKLTQATNLHELSRKE